MKRIRYRHSYRHPYRLLYRGLLLGLILILLIGSVPAGAAPSSTAGESEAPSAVSQAESESNNPNISLTVSYDYDNVIRAGYVVPAFIEIENKGAELDGEIQLNITPENSTQSIVYKMSVHVDENSTASYTLPFKALTTRNVRAQLYQDNRVVAEAKVNRNGVKLAVTGLLGILSDNPQDVAYWKAVKRMPDIYGNDTLVSPVELDESSFPEEDYLLDRFALLVLNHYDINKLNQKQQQSLVSWIKKGGVLLTDADLANAQAVQALAPLLEITVQGETALDGISEKIYELADASYSTKTEIKALSTVEPQGTIIHQLDDQPMMMEYGVEKGRVFITTFSLSEPALAHTSLIYSFFGKAGMSALESSEMENAMYNWNEAVMTEAVRNIEWLDAASIGWVLILLIVFIVLVGPVNYAILSLKDKRDWIWFTAPALSIIFCAVIIGSGIYRHGSTPIASVVSVIDSRGQDVNSSSTIGIGAPGTGSYDISLGEEGFPSKYLYSDYYYYGGTGEKISDMGTPQLYFDVSGETKVTFPRLSRWDMDSFKMERDIQLEGGLDVNITLEKKVTLYDVKNNTGSDLEDVTLALPDGYVRIPFLASGEEKSGEVNEYAYTQNSGYSVASYGYGIQMDYSYILGEIYGGPEFMQSSYGVETDDEDTRTAAEKRQDYTKFTIMTQLLTNNYYSTGYVTYVGASASSGYSATQYTAWAWSGELGKMDIDVNGSPAKNEMNLAVVLDDAVVSFESSQGLSIPKGYITGYVADISGLKNGSAYVGNTDGYIVEGEIIYEFQLPEVAEKYTIDSLLVSVAGYSDGDYHVSFKNNSTGNWDSFRFNVAVSGDSVQSYVNGEGIVQMQIKKEPQDDADVSYEASFDGLTLSVEGTVK